MGQRKKIDYSMMERVTEISEEKQEQKRELVNAMKKAIYLEMAIVLIGMGMLVMMAIICTKVGWL